MRMRDRFTSHTVVCQGPQGLIRVASQQCHTTEVSVLPRPVLGWSSGVNHLFCMYLWLTPFSHGQKVVVWFRVICCNVLDERLHHAS